jgi:hypothetical protein
MVRERAIIMAASSVTATLAGRKTNTRRLITADWVRTLRPGADHLFPAALTMCPYGQNGDRLWVKEAWRTAEALDALNATEIAAKAIDASYDKPWAPLVYEDGTERNYDRVLPRESGGWGGPGRKRLARFMPR